jgi:hypothetical protein
MIRSRVSMLCAALLTGAALLSTAAPAKAAITIAISIDGGATFSTFAGAEGQISFAAPDVTTAGGTVISVRATTNEPLNSAVAQISQVQININGGASIDVIPLVVRISDRDFDQPVSSNSVLSSSFSGTVGPNTTVTDPIGPGPLVSTFQSVIDNSNTLFGGLPGVLTPGPTDTTGLQVVTIPLVSGTDDFSGTASKVVSNVAPFSLSNEFRLLNLTIASGTQIQFTGTTTLSVPAPAGLLLALSGLPVLGLRMWRRRKAQAAETV